MFTRQQKAVLENFADKSDTLFNLGVITTDSFTGEIGEYIACKHFKLKKSARVTRAIDAICGEGLKYQIKSKVVANGNLNYNITKLACNEFDFLVVVYFDHLYNPIKILRIPSGKIINDKISITKSVLGSGIELVNKEEIKVPSKIKNALSEFAKVYEELQNIGIIRSRRIVGDIGEYYASKRLGLNLCGNKTEKGIDAIHVETGLSFEIKTRRVYESGRRKSEVRRLNNLANKSADFVIVVVLDRSFKCAGMWILPPKCIVNPKSAQLTIVNTTIGVKNLVPSKIDWLRTGERFISLNKMHERKRKVQPEKTIKLKTKEKKAIITSKPQNKPTPVDYNQQPKKDSFEIGCFGWMILFAILVYIYGQIKYGGN
jgi:hypothetical protein